jgi:hypothetical protein
MLSSPARSATPDTEGVVWPRAADGSRSSLRAGAAIVAAALEPLGGTDAAAARAERRWRHRYPTHIRRLVEGALGDPAAAMASARAGLHAAWQTLHWAEGDEERPLDAVLERARPGTRPGHDALGTGTVRGTGDPRPAAWAIPYRGERLEGDRLRRRIDAWAAEGVIEASAAAALHRCADHPEWFDLSDRTMVLLGAGSEAGPLSWLARWRATILAVDVARPGVWQRIAGLVRAGNAVLHAPVRGEVAHDGAGAGGEVIARAGADLLAHAPAIARWICSFDGPLDVAAHAYLDGERHVRLAVAMDLIQRAACAGRPGTTLAFLATPTDVFAVPREAALVSMESYRARSRLARTLQLPLRLVARDRFFAPNVARLHQTPAGPEYGIVDSLVVEQGPNYALAKRLQLWRALVARAEGHRVSANVGPSTTTASVVSNPALAAGFAGAAMFGVEVFEPETTNAVMAALWVHDLRAPESAANPARPLPHPFDLFVDGACHGGLWRVAYRPRSALVFAAAAGWLRRRAASGPTAADRA